MSTDGLRPSHEETGASTPHARIPADLIHEQVDKILNSPGFAQSQRLIRFLRFIVEQYLKNEADQLKEYRLGVSVFDRDSSYDPRTDPIVRVEASRLRAKLREYYDSEGRDDPVVIEMPKGSYAPTVVLRADVPSGSKVLTPVPPERRSVSRTVLVLSLLLAAGSLAAGGYFYLQSRQLRQDLRAVRPSQSLEPGLSSLWGRFLTPGVETYVVFGSPMFFASSEHGLFLRPYGIHDIQGLESNPAYQDLQRRFGLLTGPRYDYAVLGEVLAVHRLTDFLVRRGGRLTALPSYKTTWDAIQNGNIILLGAPRMNHLMQHFPRPLDFEWDSDENVRNRRPLAGEDQVYRAQFHEGFFDKQTNPELNAQTYAIVAFLPGLRPNRELLLVSVHGGPGLWESVDCLTSPEAARGLVQQLRLPDSRTPQHLQMLLRVYVDRGIPVRTEYVTHHTTE